MKGQQISSLFLCLLALKMILFLFRYWNPCTSNTKNSSEELSTSDALGGSEVFHKQNHKLSLPQNQTCVPTITAQSDQFSKLLDTSDFPSKQHPQVLMCKTCCNGLSLYFHIKSLGKKTINLRTNIWKDMRGNLFWRYQQECLKSQKETIL